MYLWVRLVSGLQVQARRRKDFPRKGADIPSTNLVCRQEGYNHRRHAKCAVADGDIERVDGSKALDKKRSILRGERLAGSLLEEVHAYYDRSPFEVHALEELDCASLFWLVR
jgi:hypothetical protein